VIARRPQPVERRRVAVAQHGLVARRQHCPHPPPFASQASVADGVDAWMEPDELPPGRPALDHLRGEADREQLPSRHHPMLPRRQRPQHLVRMIDVFSPCEGVNPSIIRHPATLAAHLQRRGPGLRQ
jgi:hypothetical protein